MKNKIHSEIFFRIMIIMIMLGSVPIHTAILTQNIEHKTLFNQKIMPLRGDSCKEFNFRLLNLEKSKELNDKSGTIENYLSINNLMPNLDIVTGEGGGIYEINDSLNINYIEVLDTSNLWYSDNRTDGFSIIMPSGFTNNSGLFNISNIKAEQDWRAIENNYSPLDFVGSDAGFLEVAMEFNTSETYANLSRIRVVVNKQSQTIPPYDDPTGNLIILNGSYTGSKWEPNSSEPLSSPIALTGGGWDLYEFSENITLHKDIHYFIILNDTTSGSPGAHWHWGAQKDYTTDGGDGIDEGEFYYKTTHDDLWNPQAGLSRLDLNLYIEVLPVVDSGSEYIQKTFSSPEEINLVYNNSIDETYLTKFNWFDWNATSDNIHRFTTNTSVAFDLTWIVNLTYSYNPIIPIASYLIQNNSKALWSLTFISSSISTSYNVRNRTFSISRLRNDWDGRAIYHSTTLVYNQTNDGLFNDSVSYSNKSSMMIINTSTLATTTNWNITFDAPNYLYDFNISLSGTPLDLPYQVYTMNDYSLDFEVYETDGNITYWIDYPNGSQVLRKDFNRIETTISDIWDISNTFDNIADVNGTYNLQAFWNNSDCTKVGTFTRHVEMIVNTTFNYDYDDEEVVINTYLNITVHYNSTHNETGIDYANVSCLVEWGGGTSESVTFNHTIGTHEPYTFSMKANDTVNSPGQSITVTIYAELSGYVGNSTVLIFKAVANATITTDISPDFVLEWRNNRTIEIEYNETSGTRISGATVTVNNTAVTNITNDLYYFKFNSTDYSGVGSYLNLMINASHPNYLTIIWYFNLTINPGITNITSSKGIENKTTIITQKFSESDLDSVAINLGYYHELTYALDNKLLEVIVEPSVQTPFSTSVDKQEEANHSWTITFNPDLTGTFAINISFSLTNYKNALFIFNLTILEASTRIQTSFQNNSQFYYNEPFIFTLFYNNTDYNENITFNHPSSGTITINDSSVQYLTRLQDDYRFEISSTPVSLGVYIVNITFEGVANFDPASIIVIFEIIKSPFVDLISSDATNGTILVNGTSTYTVHYSPTEFDSISVSFSYFENKTSQILDLSMNNISISVDSSILVSNLYEETNNNWTITFNATELGTYLLQIMFSHENYTSRTFLLYYRIVKADSYIALTSFNVQGSPINATLMSGDNITFWLIWRSEYGEDLTDPVIESHNATVILIDTPGMGIHSFNHTGGDVGIVTFNLTFGTAYYNSINYTMRFLITDRGLVVAKEPLTTHYSNATHPYISPTGYLHYGDRYYFYVFINDSITGSPLDIIEADISTSINVTFVNGSSGRHLFYYDAWIIARIVSHQISIQFSKANYVSVNYQISFFVDYADSEILYKPGSIYTYYSQNTYFSVVWQSIPNSGISTTLLRINSTNISISESLVTFIGVNNGNYTFLITSNIVDVFSVRIDFHSAEFIDQFFIFQLTILPVPTHLGVFTSPLNASVVGDTSLLYFSQTYEFTVQWLDDFNDSGIVDSSIVISGTGMDYLSTNYQTFANGNHQLTYHANATGTYQVIIMLETTNFAKLVYEITFIVTIMPTSALNPANIDFNKSILIEDVLYINGSGFKTFENESIPTIDSIFLWLNDSSVPEVEFEFLSFNNQFWVNFSTQGYQWGVYNVSVMLEAIGYQSQSIDFSVTLLGREINLTVSLPVATIEQGQSIEITAILEYAQITTAGIGAELSLATLAGVDITFYIGLNYQNGSIKYFETITQTDILGEASYMIDGKYTKAATGFANITVNSASFSSGLPARYSMSEEELAHYKITQFLDPFEILIPAAIIFTLLGAFIGSVYTINRRRKRKIETRIRGERKVEQSFEDIKSIRLIIARHESGLQFYSEKTIADLTTDTDALSGMSAAISSFMEEVSDSMASRSGEEKRHEIEMMSREGLHMLIWHGNYSSLIIISEVRLPDYFQDRLRGLGLELEKKYVEDLKNFYSSDQIPSSVVKKMVRKFIPLHYFSAFILNEGVLTLESIRLTSKQKKMLKQMKEIRFLKEGIQFFFSEQIISQLSHHWKRSEAIKFLNQAIEWNLLIEASQEDIINLQK